MLTYPILERPSLRNRLERRRPQMQSLRNRLERPERPSRRRRQLRQSQQRKSQQTSQHRQSLRQRRSVMQCRGMHLRGVSPRVLPLVLQSQSVVMLSCRRQQRQRQHTSQRRQNLRWQTNHP